MSRSKIFILIFLSIVAIILLAQLVVGQNSEESNPMLDGQSTYQTRFTDTFAYAPTGTLQYRLIANDIRHYAQQGNSWFHQPVLTLFNEEMQATWTITANRAELTREQQLYLYGNVKIRSQLADSQLKTIDTENAELNLKTLDVSSEDQVILTGIGFHSSGLKMRGNLHIRQAALIEKVKTTYELQKS